MNILCIMNILYIFKKINKLIVFTATAVRFFIKDR